MRTAAPLQDCFYVRKTGWGDAHLGMQGAEKFHIQVQWTNVQVHQCYRIRITCQLWPFASSVLGLVLHQGNGYWAIQVGLFANNRTKVKVSPDSRLLHHTTKNSSSQLNLNLGLMWHTPSYKVFGSVGVGDERSLLPWYGVLRYQFDRWSLWRVFKISKWVITLNDFGGFTKQRAMLNLVLLIAVFQATGSLRFLDIGTIHGSRIWNRMEHLR